MDINTLRELGCDVCAEAEDVESKDQVLQLKRRCWLDQVALALEHEEPSLKKDAVAFFQKLVEKARLFDETHLCRMAMLATRGKSTEASHRMVPRLAVKAERQKAVVETTLTTTRLR